MPELPEVETVRRGLNQVTPGQIIVGGEVLLQRTIAYPLFSGDFLTGLEGCRIQSWYRRGKYLLAALSSDPQLSPVDISSLDPALSWLGVHLRMTGQLLWVNSTEPVQKHTRVRLFFENDQELRFVDQRTFGQMWWVSPMKEVSSIVSGLQELGPEPLSSDFSVAYLAEKLRCRHRAIKTTLLDQTVIAGLGNIYADESLFLSQIRPTIACKDLNLDQVKRLHSAIVEVLQTAIQAGGTTFSNFLNVQGVNGNYGGVAWVYHRAGQGCRVCDTPIERLKLAGRSTHFCPQCQD